MEEKAAHVLFEHYANQVLLSFLNHVLKHLSVGNSLFCHFCVRHQDELNARQLQMLLNEPFTFPRGEVIFILFCY